MSRVVSAVMKLCEWMNKVEDIGNNLETEYRRVHIDAVHLEQRWHEVWIQSVEWQVRLEDALTGNCVSNKLSYFIVIVYVYTIAELHVTAFT